MIRAAASGATIDDAQLLRSSDRLAVPETIHLGLVIAALIAFALWLSRVISNVPALGGGVPGTTPTRAFVYTLIPIWNLFKVPGMVQDALYRLDPQAGGFFMIMVAWFGLVGSWLVSIVANIVIGIALASGITLAVAARSRELAADALLAAVDQSVAVTVATSIMVVVGASLLVLIMARIERRARARDREIRVVAAATVPVPVVEPAVEAPLPGVCVGYAPGPTRPIVERPEDRCPHSMSTRFAPSSPPSPASRTAGPSPTSTDPAARRSRSG